MVHIYKCLNRNFMLDVESGSIFEIDDITYQIAKQRYSSANNTAEEFFGVENGEVIAELEELEREGILNSPQLPYPKPRYSGVVKALCLNICHDCNLNCEYCFADGGAYHGKKEYMSFEVAKSAIDMLVAKSGDRHNLEVDFFGGEPLLNLDVVKQTVAYSRSLEKKFDKLFRFTITTNAIALTDEITEYLNQEMHNVVLSIDGRESVHNTVRKTINGKGSYATAMQNVLKFKRKRGDKSYYVRGTFTALNLDFCEDVLAINDLGFDQISIEPVVLPESNRLAIRQEHLPAIISEYEKLALEYVKRRKTDKWFNFFHFMIDISGGPCALKRLSGCGSGTEYLAISPDGNIYPCHQFVGDKQYKIGNVLDNTFSDVIPKRFANTNLTTKPECLTCFAKYYCSGGCSANSINYAGDINKPYGISCQMMKKRVECALAIGAIEKIDN